MALPALFVSHGSPLVAMHPGTTGPAWARIGAAMPRPAAILVLSAHWDTLTPAVSLAATPKTLHDFQGFPQDLYSLLYRAPGAPDVATRVLALLAAAGIEAKTHPDRGLDHGAWVPLRAMYPAADIPVVQLSIQSRQGAAYHLRLGAALAPLRSDGVLIIGSGSLTHNLAASDPRITVDTAPSWVSMFTRWMHEKLAASDRESLIKYRLLAPQAARNHPTEEHLMPLFAAWGAGEAPVATLHRGYTHGVLAMDALAFG
jgi:4,5-DOPA dioxygenase extradiol